MNKNKIDINSTEPINSIAEVDRVVDAFVKRGGVVVGTVPWDRAYLERIKPGVHVVAIGKGDSLTISNLFFCLVKASEEFFFRH